MEQKPSWAGVASGNKPPPMALALPDTMDIRELAKSAVPSLMRKAIEMAWESNSLREVMDVLREVADRGYGKSTGSVEIKLTTHDEGLAALRDLVEAGVMDAAGAREAAREIGFEWVDAEVVTDDI